MSDPGQNETVRAEQQQGGLIATFVRHPTAANILMIIMVALGLLGANNLQVQFFPTIEVPIIVVQVEWPGASAADVESQILDALEPELRFLDGVRATNGMAREGSAQITLEFDADEDMQKALADAERAVAEVATLPTEAETPTVSRVTFYEPVTKIAITGPFGEEQLKHYARLMRDGLLADGIEQVELIGIREEEIAVLVPEAAQRELDLTIAQIAERVRSGVQNIPAGTLEGAREIQLRSVETRQTPEEIAQIEVRALPNGEKITIADIATVQTRFDRNAAVGQIKGRPAVELRVKRALSADTLETQAIVDAYLERARAELPPTLQIKQYDTTGEFVVQRIAVLLENGILGLVLVLVALSVFLNVRTAFWVAVGIPVAILGTLGIVWLTGQSLNMVSVFSLIMMIGIIVDDAIVVGEQIAVQSEEGLPPHAASIRGARSMLKPVMAATLTTAAAFLPIFAITGPIGQVMQVIPMVVIAVLIASTMECFLILPAHLSHFRAKNREPSAFRRRFDAGFARFRDHHFRRFLVRVVEWRYAFAAFLFALLVALVGLIAGERLKSHFFLAPEAEIVRASIVFVPGVPLDDQTEALMMIEAALQAAEASLAEPGNPLVNATFTTVGAYEVFDKIRLQNVAQIEIALTSSEAREVPTDTLIAAWREAIPPIAGVTDIAVSPVDRALTARAIEVQLQDAPIGTLKAAAVAVAEELRRFAGVNAVVDNLPYGKEELIIGVSASGSALGFTMEDVGLQVRNLVEGATADRFARGDEEVVVKVLRDSREQRPDLEVLPLQNSAGQWVPFSEVATLREADSFAIIRRAEGKRTVTVSADVDTTLTSASRVVAALNESFLPAISERYGVTVTFDGQTRQQNESFEDLFLGLSLAGIFIYAILALVLESYVRPLFVMAIIPFGAVGALAGHLVMGIDLTIVSFVGFLGLTGVLVNDSIILIDRTAQRISAGEALKAAAIAASQDRLRAVILTSVTTILGLLPLLFETSRQAQFLIPLAVTFIYGLLASTMIVTTLIPVFFAIVEDLRSIVTKIYRVRTESHAADESREHS
ncbi:MAG: efflux RND transporter permease subunit [Devosia sp.]